VHAWCIGGVGVVHAWCIGGGGGGVVYAWCMHGESEEQASRSAGQEYEHVE
jgi:hypothetical protein